MTTATRRLTVASAAIVLLSSFPTSAQPDNLEIRQTTYVYKTTPQGKLNIVVHYPPDWKASDKRPAMVFFFGGGWKGGNIKQFLTQARYLAGRGMVTARAEYRIKNKHKTLPDKCVLDAKSAIRWLRQNAGKLGIDPNRVVAAGGSAGGHLAIAAYTTKNMEPEGEDLTISSKPNLLVLYNPALSTTQFADKMGGKEMAKKLSPNDNLTKDVPPAVLFFGTKDFLLDGAKEYMKLAKKLDLDAKLYMAKDQKHGFFNRSPWTEATLYHTDQFLQKHGYLEGQATIDAKKGALLTLEE